MSLESLATTRPSIEDPSELMRLLAYIDDRDSGRLNQRRRVNKTEVDVTLGHKETLVGLPDELPNGFHWIAPALAYTLVGMDRSLLKIFYAEQGLGRDIPTYRSEDNVMILDDVTTTADWYRVIQGIPDSDFAEFEAFINRFQVSRKADKSELSFALHATPFRGTTLHTVIPVFVTGGCMTFTAYPLNDRSVGVRIE